jgi:hypothetical protein
MPAARSDQGDQEGHRRRIRGAEEANIGVKRKTPATRAPKTKRRRPATRKKRTALTRRRAPQAPAFRWNPDPEDVQRSVVQLVLGLVEFIRKLMERQAIRRVEEKSLTPEEIENVGLALMKLEQTVHLIAKRFKIDPKELNLDLGPIGRLH